MHDMWLAWARHEIEISEHDIHNVRVAWQCGSKAPQTQVSKWNCTALVRVGLANCLANSMQVHKPTTNVGVLIAHGEDWEGNGKPNSMTITARMVCPFARSLQTPLKAHLL